MLDAIAGLMGSQRGLVLRRQVLAAGLGEPDIHRLVRAGEWVVVRRGVYATALLWESLDDRDGRPLLRAYAASLNMSLPHVLSHESAALALGMPVLRARPQAVHITRPGVVGCRTKHGVCHHKAPFEPWQVSEVRGVPTFDRARTAVDIARGHSGQDGLRHGVVACDSAMRAGATRAELETALAPMRNWPNVTVARTCVALATGESDSVAESLGRLMVLGLGVGEVHVQFGLHERGRVAWVDLRVGRHLIEVDGRAKYVRQQEGGLADRDPGAVVWDEKQREDWLRGHDLGMSRLTWADLMPSGWRAAQTRLRREITETERRWGTDLTDLAPYVITQPRVRLEPRWPDMRPDPTGRQSR